MKKYLQHSRFYKSIAVALVVLQLFTIGAGDLVAAAGTAIQNAIPAGPSPSPNRTAPKVQPISALPKFSDPPTDIEIMRGRVFEEPLIAMGPATTREENRRLAEAITTYLKSGNTEDVSVMEAFLGEYPTSAWSASLLTDLGIVY